MNAKAVWDITWNIFIVDGWSVLWRVSLCTLAFGLAGVLLTAICYRLFYRGGHLRLKWKHERYYEWSTVALWMVGLPCLGACLGSLLGGWWAGGFLIKAERLGERMGTATFKAVAAGIASANFKGTETEKAQLAKAYMSGERKVTITQLQTYTSHHAGKVSAESVCRLLSTNSDGKLHNTTAWAVEKTLDTIAYYQLGDEGDILYKLASKVAQHDRETDNDGLVTVEEISEIACKNFLDKSIGRLWTGMMIQVVFPVALAFGLLPVGPPLVAWLTRRTRVWWLHRRKQKLDATSEAPKDSRLQP